MAKGNTPNSFTVMGDHDQLIAFLKSNISSCDTIIGHYDFVINDISSDISNPKLEAKKRPVIAFLKELRGEWTAYRGDVQKKLDEMTAGERKEQ